MYNKKSIAALAAAIWKQRAVYYVPLVAYCLVGSCLFLVALLVAASYL